MDARLTDEQQALQEVVRRIVRDQAATTVVELGQDTRRQLLGKHLAESGLTELRSTEAGSTSVEVALVAEQLAQGVAEVAFLGPVLAADLCRRAGREVPAGATVALTADLSTLAGVEELAGAVAFDAAGSTVAVLLTRHGGGLGLALATISAVKPSLDLTRPTGRMGLAGVEQLAPPGSLTETELELWLAFGRSMLAADLLGAARAAHTATVEYAKIREQYGRAISKFQAVQHLLADSLVWLEGAWSAAYYAAWAADAEPLEGAREAAIVAKAYCSASARSVCETAIQVHGGIGNTWECMVHVFLRRVLMSSQTLGDEGQLLEELAVLRIGAA